MASLSSGRARLRTLSCVESGWRDLCSIGRPPLPPVVLSSLAEPGRVGDLVLVTTSGGRDGLAQPASSE